MKKIFSLLAITILITSCAPTNFIETSDVNWSTVQIRDDLEFDKAWNQVIDVLAKKFEMAMISKDGAYARTGWIYTWNTKGKYTNDYRNRVIIKFSPDRKQVEIKTEAQYGSEGKWKNGYDSRLLKTIKQDIMGVVGRTTR
jgi:allantoicase